MRVMDLIRKVFNLDESTTSSPSVKSSLEGHTPSVRDRYTPVIQDQINRLTRASSNTASLVGRTVLTYLPDAGDVDAIIDRGPQIASAAKEMLKRSVEYFDLDLMSDKVRLGTLLLKTLQTEVPAFRMQ